MTHYLDPKMFADDTNLFQILNSELKLAKFSLNTKKYVLLCKLPMCDSLLLQLPSMTFNSIEIKRENPGKFLGVIKDENLTWKNHIEVVENKFFKILEFFRGLIIYLISETF